MVIKNQCERSNMLNTVQTGFWIRSTIARWNWGANHKSQTLESGRKSGIQASGSGINRWSKRECDMEDGNLSNVKAT